MNAKTKYISAEEESARCMMCYDAPCKKACTHGCDPSAFLRGVRLGLKGETLGEMKGCSSCTGRSCEKACIHYDFPIRLRKIKSIIEREAHGVTGCEAELSVYFCGIKCENPFFLSSSIVAGGYEMCARALRAGWGGIVFKTIGMFAAKELSPRFDAVTKERTPFVGFRNLEQISEHKPEENFAALKRLKKDFPDKVIVASIMGQSEAEWTELARRCEEADVDMIECNFSCPHMSADGLGSDTGQNPALVASYTAAVKRGTGKPVLTKMTPNLGSMIPAAAAALEAGADGLAAINTVKSLTGFNPDTHKPRLDVAGKTAVSGYSGKAVKPIALRFLYDIKSADATKHAQLSGVGGIETWSDALDFLLIGCRNVQITTAVMQYGYRIIDQLKSGLSAYMRRNGYKRLDEFIGKGLDALTVAGKLDRETTEYPCIDTGKCAGCGRCYISCSDAGHQAITWNVADRTPVIDKSKCKGCQLCLLVCPSHAVYRGKRI
jgi:dihydropyrimidine dehydrogenase (NAD+) subunit PreA